MDAVVQKRKEANENAALVQMVDRSDIAGPAIVIADRGCEAYNTLEHIARKGWKYLIRCEFRLPSPEKRGVLSLFFPDRSIQNF